MKKFLALAIPMMFMFTACSDNGVSNIEDDYTFKKCDYTIRHYHPNPEYVDSIYNRFMETNPQSFDNYNFAGLRSRITIDDTTVYRNEMWSNDELEQYLNQDFVTTEDDEMMNVLLGNADYNQLLAELDQRKGELLDVSCHD